MQTGGTTDRSLAAGPARVLLAALAVSTAALALSACGTSSSTPAPATTPSQEELLSVSELEKHPPGSPERAFLAFWSDLQFQAWADVGAYYDPSFREFVGTATLIGAKKSNASAYQVLRPRIVRTRERDDETTTIYYTLNLADGRRELASISWRRNDGNWQIVHDSRLDAELNQLARNRAEIQLNGALPTDPSKPPSPQAVRAGEKASQLQARFLQQELSAEAP